MKRIALMVFMVALLAALATVAQAQSNGTRLRRSRIERAPSPAAGPTDLEILTGRANGRTHQAAPQYDSAQDDPSGPTDLDILTGKADRESRPDYRSYYTPYVYGPGTGYGYRSRFGHSQFRSGSSPLPFRASFGRFRNQSFFVFRGGGSSFFFSSRLAGHSGFFFHF